MEFDEALDRAELLSRGVQDMRRSIRWLTFFETSTIMTAFVIVVIALSVGRPSAMLAVAIVLAAASGTAVITAAMHIMLIQPLRPQIRRDERAMIELVDMLRELAPYLSRRNHWSEARRFLVRTRLERFPVGAEDAK